MPDGQKLMEPKKDEAPRVIPKLNVSEVRVRAGRAFDAAVSEVMRINFSKPEPPSRKEIKELNDFANRAVAGKEGQMIDFSKVLDDFVEKNPDSTVAKYYYLTDSTAWILSEKGGIRFSGKDLKQELTNYLSSYKSEVVKACASLADPSKDNYEQDVKDIEELLPGIPAQLQAALQRQFAGKTNALAISVEYNEGTLAYKNLLKPEAKKYKYD